MSYYPKKGMWRDETGTARFITNVVPSDLTAVKRWFRAEIRRVIFDGKGKILRESKQETSLYCVPDAALGTALRRCPNPWMATDGKVETYINVHPLLALEGV